MTPSHVPDSVPYGALEEVKWNFDSLKSGSPDLLGIDLEVSALGLGCMSMSELYGPPADTVALGWLLAQKSWIVPIPGTTKLHRLEENLGAVDLELTTEDRRYIRAELSKVTVQAERLPEAALKMTGR